MKAIPVAVAAFAVAGMMAVSPRAMAQGVPCGTQTGTQPVTIRVMVGATPKADPDTCKVDQGTVITWVAEPPAEFTLEFGKSGSPGGASAPTKITAKPMGGTFKAVVPALGKAETYPYVIRVNGVAVDPAIIIRAQ